MSFFSLYELSAKWYQYPFENIHEKIATYAELQGVIDIKWHFCNDTPLSYIELNKIVALHNIISIFN